MSLDADEVVVGANGRVWVAPAGTAVPDDMGSLNVAYVNVGYLSEDGIKFKNGQKVDDINAWQSFYPIRKVVSSKNTGVEFVMRQWDNETLKLAFGGGTVIDDDSGVCKLYIPAAPGELDERGMVIEWEDGDNDYRLVLPRGMATGDTETHLMRTSAADLPISFEVTPQGQPDALTDPPTPAQLKTQPWYLVTNAVQFTT